LKKNGKFRYIPISNSYKLDVYKCIYNKVIYSSEIEFPNLIGTEEDIINKLLLINYYRKKADFKYIIINKNKNSIILYNSDIKDIYNKIIITIILNQHNINNLYEFILYHFIFYRSLSSKIIKDDDIFTKIFYSLFNKKILPLLNINIDIDFNKIPNYHQLYLYVKKTQFYKKYIQIVSIIKKTYKKVYNDLYNSDDFKIIKKKMNKKIKNFSDINIDKLINKLPNYYNKLNIKNKYLKMLKKYNV
jgi:hypothetical protein